MTKPIKRSEHIIILSRDHHHTLLLCWKIRRGIANAVPPERISAYADFFNRRFVKHHFLQEEELLFARLPENDPLRTRAFAEHAALQSLFSESIDHPGYEVLSKLASTLDAHIRFEERTLFPHIENTLSHQQLWHAQHVLEAEPHTEETNWPDAFWEKQ